jgi:hypothetical protein
VVHPQTDTARHIYLLSTPLPLDTLPYISKCQYQRAICLVRSDDGRKILNDGQIMESWRIINKDKKHISHTQNVNDVWFTCLLDCVENKETIEHGRQRQYGGIKEMKDRGYITVDDYQYPLSIWGPADLKNLTIMYQRGGNPGTTKNFCTHCAKTKSERSLWQSTPEGRIHAACFRVGSGTRDESIS